jgi:hypothetical protein
MKARQLWSAVLGLLLLQGQGGYAAGDLVGRQLRDEARMWETKDRDDLAAEAWNRLLLGDPQHGEAMVSLGMIHFRAGDLATARQWYTRASRLRAVPRDLGKLASALAPAQTDEVPLVSEPVVHKPIVSAKPVRERKPRKKSADEQDATTPVKQKSSRKTAAMPPSSVLPPPSVPSVPPVPMVPMLPMAAPVIPVAPVVTPAPAVPLPEPVPPKPRPSKALPYFPPL